MDMKKMMMQAQAIQAKLEKFKKEKFVFTEQENLISITITGNRQILAIDIKKLITEVSDDYEMINDMLKVALNNSLKEIDKKEKAIAGNFK